MTQIDVSAVTHNVLHTQEEITASDAHERAVAIAKKVLEELDYYIFDNVYDSKTPLDPHFDFVTHAMQEPEVFTMVREFACDKSEIDNTIIANNPVRDQKLMAMLYDRAYSQVYDGNADDGSYWIERDLDTDFRIVDVIVTPERIVVITHYNLVPME